MTQGYSIVAVAVGSNLCMYDGRKEGRKEMSKSKSKKNPSRLVVSSSAFNEDCECGWVGAAYSSIQRDH